MSPFLRQYDGHHYRVYFFTCIYLVFTHIYVGFFLSIWQAISVHA